MSTEPERFNIEKRWKNACKTTTHPNSVERMFKTLSYYWNAARGYRLKPWKSPYLRWRFETFLGKEAADLTARKFFHLHWKYREHMQRFVGWAAERRRVQSRRHACKR